MALGRKTGGRLAGTPNRKTKEVAEILASLGHDPISAMVEIARNPKASLDLRGRMNAELLNYVYPRRKAIEVSSDTDNVTRRITVHYVDSPEKSEQPGG